MLERDKPGYDRIYTFVHTFHDDQELPLFHLLACTAKSTADPNPVHQ